MKFSPFFVAIAGLSCQRSPVLAVQHVGAWTVQNASQGGGWASITWLNGNLTQIESNFDTTGQVALYPVSWTVPQQQLCYAPVPHQQTYPNGTFPCATIDPDYKLSWKKQWRQIKPLVDKGAIVGVFLGDERMYFGLKLSQVKLIADEVRADFLSAIIYLNEAPDITMCNMRKDNTTVFDHHECIPTNIDWFGMDFYASDSSSWTAPMQTLNSIMGPRFGRTSQRWIPTTLGHDFSSSTVTPEDDAWCVQNGLEWMKLALEEPRIAALFTFGGVFGPGDNSRCSQLWEGFGKMVIAAGQDGTSLDPMANPPTPNAAGGFDEARCISPSRAAPAIWDWCDRTADRAWTCDPISKACVRSVVGTFPTSAACAASCT